MSLEELYTPNIDANRKKLQHVHDVVSLTLGVVAGVLALESLHGFLFYVAGLTVVNTVFVAVACEGQVARFFPNSWYDVFVTGISTNLAGYVMMWCLVYALVK